MKHQPSRSAGKILRWFVNAEFVEEIEGDLDELFYERLSTHGWLTAQEALSHRIHWQRKEYEVIGVFSNYNHLFLKETFEPIILNYNPSAGFLTFKADEGYYEQALAAAQKEMQVLFPTAPFEYDFLESAYDHQYRGIVQFELLAKCFAFLAIVIACLGLFALSYFSTQKRTREMAVRKVFGAGIFDVLVLLSRNYLRISLVSCLLGSLLAFYLMRDWLQNFAFAVHLGLSDFFIPCIAITCIVALTMGYNCFKTSFVNPSHSLKNH
jgi:putative ABC transport system permease protein